VWGQNKIKAVPFAFVPDNSEDQYLQRLKHKTLPVNETDFVILSKKKAGEYAVERYDGSLRKLWSTPIVLSAGEVVEAFSLNRDNIFVLTHKADKTVGSQQLTAHIMQPGTGQLVQSKKIFEAPSQSRKIGVSVSEDGSKICA